MFQLFLWDFCGQVFVLMHQENNRLTRTQQSNSAVSVKVFRECICGVKGEAADKLRSTDNVLDWNNPPVSAITGSLCKQQREGIGGQTQQVTGRHSSGESLLFSPMSGSECVLMCALHQRRIQARDERQQHNNSGQLLLGGIDAGLTRQT